METKTKRIEKLFMTEKLLFPLVKYVSYLLLVHFLRLSKRYVDREENINGPRG